MDTFDLIATERLRLADALAPLRTDEWESLSLCAGWSVHVVAAHLNAPWTVSIPRMVVAITRSLSLPGGLDRVARDVAVQLDPAACVIGLRDNAGSHFTPPGSGPEAPLTDVLVHGSDMLVPLRREVDPAPDALGTSLGWLAGGGAKGFVAKGRVDGLVFEATDLDRSFGSGTAVVRGPALDLCGVLCGRAALLDRLTGDGVPVLGARI
jgi:uncharacterized protein (TIGR03083 family)